MSGVSFECFKQTELWLFTYILRICAFVIKINNKQLIHLTWFTNVSGLSFMHKSNRYFFNNTECNKFVQK